jgi:outer membrane immunogenic protein
MKKLIVAAAFVALSSASAFAADLPMRTYTKAPIASPIFSWTGLYIGANGGCSASRQTINSFPPSDATDVYVGDFTTDGGGCFGGGQIGYNYQFSGNWVFGIEADAQAASIKGRGTIYEDDFAESSTYQHKLTSFGTVRGRLGWATTFGATPILPYVTGGWAWGRNKVSVVADIGDTPTFPTSDAATHSGWTVGGGLEVAMTSNWTLKGEYLYLDLGSKNYGTAQFEGPLDTGNPQPGANIGLKVHTVKVGINYLFH